MIRITNANAGNPNEKEIKKFQKRISASFTYLKDKLAKGKLDPDTPICVIGGARIITIDLAIKFSNPILFLGKRDFHDRPILASQLIADGSGIYITCSNVQRDKTKTPELAKFEFFDENGKGHDIPAGLMLPRNQVQQEQLMGGAAAAMQGPRSVQSPMPFGGFSSSQAEPRHPAPAQLGTSGLAGFGYTGPAGPFDPSRGIPGGQAMDASAEPAMQGPRSVQSPMPFGGFPSSQAEPRHPAPAPPNTTGSAGLGYTAGPVAPFDPSRGIPGGQAMDASAGAAMQQPGFYTPEGAGSVNFSDFTNPLPPQPPQSLPGVGSQGLLSPFPVRPGAEGLGYSGGAAPPSQSPQHPQDHQDTFLGVPPQAAMQTIIGAMGSGPHPPITRGISFDLNADVSELASELSDEEELEPGKTPRLGRRSPSR